MNIGFTGTRDGMTEAQWHWLKRTIRAHITPTITNTFHHGCCQGADREAHDMVYNIEREGFISVGIIGHPPLSCSLRMPNYCFDDLREPKPYLERNHDIVDECDRLIACPAGAEEQRSGTWATIRYARKRRKPITIIWRDGSITEENEV